MGGYYDANTEWQLRRTLKALELAAKHIAEMDCVDCPVRTGCRVQDGDAKATCDYIIAKHFIRKTRGIKR